MIVEAIRVEFDSGDHFLFPCVHRPDLVLDFYTSGPECYECWDKSWTGAKPAWVVGVSLEWEGLPVLMIGWTTDPERYIDELDVRWDGFGGYSAYQTRGKKEARAMLSQFTRMRIRCEIVPSLLDYGIRVPRSSNAFLIEDATVNLLGTWMLTFLPQHPNVSTVQQEEPRLSLG